MMVAKTLRELNAKKKNICGDHFLNSKVIKIVFKIQVQKQNSFKYN